MNRKLIESILEEVNREQNNVFRRVDRGKYVDVYIGYVHQKTALIIKGSQKITNIEKTKWITTQINQDPKTKITSLSFILEKDEFESLFISFCADIIENTKGLVTETVLSEVIARWNYWITLFKNPKREILSHSIIKGLIGELLFIKEYLLKRYSEETVIKGWVGPMGQHKDFVLNDTWFEVKTIDSDATAVKISSISQLESNEIGFLTTVNIDKSTEVSETSISLNRLIEDIVSTLQAEHLIQFDEKLKALNYEYNIAYDDFQFMFKVIDCYEVGSDFPRIKRSDVPRGIGKISYELMLNAIDSYKRG